MKFLVGKYTSQTKVQCSANGYYMSWHVLNYCPMVYVTRRGYWTWSNLVWICSTFQHVEVCPRTITSIKSNTTIVIILYTITAWCLFGWKTNFHKSRYRKTVLCWSNEIFLITVCFFALCFGLIHAITKTMKMIDIKGRNTISAQSWTSFTQTIVNVQDCTILVYCGSRELNLYKFIYNLPLFNNAIFILQTVSLIQCPFSSSHLTRFEIM